MATSGPKIGAIITAQVTIAAMTQAAADERATEVTDLLVQFNAPETLESSLLLSLLQLSFGSEIHGLETATLPCGESGEAATVAATNVAGGSSEVTQSARAYSYYSVSGGRNSGTPRRYQCV